MTIEEALRSLDPLVDDEWTTDGLPRIDVMQKLTGQRLKRADITAACPQFHRQNLEALHGPTKEPTTEDLELLSNGDAGDEDQTEAETQTIEPSEVAATTPLEILNGGKSDDPIETVIGDPGMPQPITLEVPTADMPVAGRRASYDELVQERADAEQAMMEVQKIADAAKKRADAWANHVNMLNSMIAQAQRNIPNSDTTHIREYLAQQNQNRLDRASRREAYEQATGQTPEQAAANSDLRSPIDKAMNVRPKSQRGRPQFGAR